MSTARRRCARHTSIRTADWTDWAAAWPTWTPASASTPTPCGNWPGPHGRSGQPDLVFLATLARRLEQDVVKARRDAMHYNMSAGARAALQQEGGLLLIEAGYLRDLHARLSS